MYPSSIFYCQTLPNPTPPPPASSPQLLPPLHLDLNLDLTTPFRSLLSLYRLFVQKPSKSGTVFFNPSITLASSSLCHFRLLDPRIVKAKNPNVVIVDSPDAIQRLHNRISMLQVVSELKIAQNGSETFGVPKQIVIYDINSLVDPRSWQKLKFPLIVKPLVADGSVKSHKMYLVYNHLGLTNLTPPIVLQEFINHGGVIFKVVGAYVKCVKRKSLPNVSEEKLESFVGLLSFSQVSNLTSNKRTKEKYYKKMKLDDFEMPKQ